VIASHSAVRTLANHSRNLGDEMPAIKTNGGVAQIVAFASYVKPIRPNAVRRSRR
jgi:membrane dipeptidase